MARAINADLHTRPGAILLRLGRSAQFSTALGETAIRRLHKRSTTRYQVAARTLYRDQTSILTTLSTNLFTTFVNARPLNDTSTYTFVADDSAMYRDDGSTLYQWGITAPSAAPTLGTTGTGLTGDFLAVYTYARYVSSVLIAESNPSPTPSAQTLSNQNLTVAVTASSDAQVTHINVYRSVADGTALLFDQTVANSTATITSSQADSALGSAVETDNDRPNAASWCCEFQGHVFTCRDASNPHYLWWSKRFQPEAFPSANFLELGNPSDPLQAAVPLTGLLGVFSRQTKYRVFGNATSGFTALEALSARGTPAAQAVLKTERGCVFPARDGLWLTNFIEADTELSQAIEPLFHGETVNDFAPIDWDEADEMSLATYKDRLYFAYMDTAGSRNLAVFSRDTNKWYFYDHPAKVLYTEENVDTLTAGFTDGKVYVLEDTTATGDAGSDIDLTVEPADRAGGDPYTLKRFDVVQVDASVPSGTLSVGVYIDGTLKQTFSVTGTRTRQLLKLSAQTMGRTWRVRFTYSGTARVEIHSVTMMCIPLVVA